MKRNLLQALLGLALIGIVVQVVLVAPHAIKDAEVVAPKVESTLNADGRADQSLAGMHMIETQEGGKEWELWSDLAERLKDKEILKLSHVKAIFFARSGVTFTVTGREGTVEVKSKNMRVEGDVVTRSSNGYTFKTQSADYDSAKKSLFVPGKVEMIGPRDKKKLGLNLTGKGMTAQMEGGEIEILKDVRAEKTLDKGRRIYIRSQKAFMSAVHRSARFSGDTILDMDNMRITGPEAKFDYDSDQDQIKSLSVSGGAKVTDTEKWATSQDLKIDFDENKFTFLGHPRVVQNNDELKGEEIVFLDGGKQVQVNRARAKMDGKRLGKTN
jgi:LPS export ABC transporter protein LptC